MDKLTTTTLLLIAALLPGCGDIGREVNPTEIVEANGETYVIDQSTGTVSVVDGLQLNPLESPSTEVFTLEKDSALDSTVIDFEFLFTGSQVYWSGKIMPSLPIETFDSAEEREAFLDLWQRNITQNGNYIDFGIESLSSNITFGEFRINMPELNARVLNDDDSIKMRTGNGIKTVNLDYKLIESQGGTSILWMSPIYILDIED